MAQIIYLQPFLDDCPVCGGPCSFFNPIGSGVHHYINCAICNRTYDLFNEINAEDRATKIDELRLQIASLWNKHLAK